MKKQTSIQAYRDLEKSGKSAIQRAKILKILSKRKKGLNRRALSEKTGIEINAICGRVSELLKANLIKEDDEPSICSITKKQTYKLRGVF